jgi:hypothetical protein
MRAYKKPVVMQERSFVTADGVAALKIKGLEGYVFDDFQELNHLVSLLKTRKVLQQTNMLIVTDRGLPPVLVRSCMDVNMLKDNYRAPGYTVPFLMKKGTV